MSEPGPSGRMDKNHIYRVELALGERRQTLTLGAWEQGQGTGVSWAYSRCATPFPFQYEGPLRGRSKFVGVWRADSQTLTRKCRQCLQSEIRGGCRLLCRLLFYSRGRIDTQRCMVFLGICHEAHGGHDVRRLPVVACIPS